MKVLRRRRRKARQYRRKIFHLDLKKIDGTEKENDSEPTQNPNPSR